jgi:hypothetical protein
LNEIEYGELGLGWVDEEDEEEGGVVAVDEAEVQVEILWVELEEVQTGVDTESDAGSVSVEESEQRGVEVDEVSLGCDISGCAGGVGGGGGVVIVVVLVVDGESVDAPLELVLEARGGG